MFLFCYRGRNRCTRNLLEFPPVDPGELAIWETQAQSSVQRPCMSGFFIHARSSVHTIDRMSSHSMGATLRV